MQGVNLCAKQVPSVPAGTLVGFEPKTEFQVFRAAALDIQVDMNGSNKRD